MEKIDVKYEEDASRLRVRHSLICATRLYAPLAYKVRYRYVYEVLSLALTSLQYIVLPLALTSTSSVESLHILLLFSSLPSSWCVYLYCSTFSSILAVLSLLIL